LKETYQPGSASSCCRNTASETAAQNPAILFYQPENRAISFKAFPADESVTSQQIVADIRQPHGIPHSRDMGTSKQKEEKEEETEPAPKPKSDDDGISDLKGRIKKLEEDLEITKGKLEEANEQIGNLENTLRKTGKGDGKAGLDLESMIEHLREVTGQINKENKEQRSV
jgi:hypothetical protein